MSDANVELVTRWGAAFEGDDEAAFLATLHPEVEWHPVEEAHTAFHGHAGAAQIRRQWLSTWEDHEITINELIDAGDDVLLFARLSARGVASGVEVAFDLFVHFKIRDDKVAYIYEYQDRADALAAAGNVAIVRWLFTNTGLDDDAWWTDDVEVITAPGFPEQGPFRGREQARWFVDRTREGWREVEFVMLSIEEVGDEVHVSFRWKATSETSAIPVSSEWRSIHTMRDGKVARVEFLPPTDPG